MRIEIAILLFFFFSALFAGIYSTTRANEWVRFSIAIFVLARFRKYIQRCRLLPLFVCDARFVAILVVPFLEKRITILLSMLDAPTHLTVLYGRTLDEWATSSTVQIFLGHQQTTLCHYYFPHTQLMIHLEMIYTITFLRKRDPSLTLASACRLLIIDDTFLFGCTLIA